MHTKILLLFLLIGLVAKIEARQELDAKYLHLMKVMAQVWADLSENQFNKTNVGAVSCASDDPVCIVWDVHHVPVMLYVKDGKAYRYDSDGREVDDLVEFIEHKYQSVEPEEIPQKDEYLEELSKEQWRNLETSGKVPSPAVAFTMLAVVLLGLLLCVGYCCVPSMKDEETSDELPDTAEKENEAKTPKEVGNEEPKVEKEDSSAPGELRKRNKRANKD